MLDHMQEMKLFSPDVKLTNDEIKEAVSNLTTCIELLDKIEDRMKNGFFDFLFMSSDFENAWNEVNKARIHTEKIDYIEEVIQPTMGTIYDACCMCQSMVAWKLPMTRAAFNSILVCINIAKSSVYAVLTEIESWIKRED